MMSDKKKTFIVDDDVSVCRAMSLLLESYGFDVRSFSSAEDFFSAVPDNMPGSLIMDIHMPGLGGMEALKRLFIAGSQRPIIIITADKNGGMKKKVLKLGAVGFIQKPVDEQELVGLINNTYAA